MSATTQIRPPPLRQHLAEIRQRPETWWILFRNAIPLLGVYALGWSSELAVFSYWVDGVLGVSAILLAMLPRAMRESEAENEAIRKQSLTKRWLSYAIVFPILMLFVGLPYWIVLIPFAGMGILWPVVAALQVTPTLWVAYGGMAVGRYLATAKRNYDTLPDQELRQACRWDTYLLVLRALAMFMLMAHGLYFILLPLMTLVMSYLEIWPERALGAVFGDPKRLWVDKPQGKRGRLP